MLKFVNIFLFQFLFFRLTKHTEGMYKGSLYGDYGKKQWYSIQLIILPFTGWANDFLYVWGIKKFIKIPFTTKIK